MVIREYSLIYKKMEEEKKRKTTLESIKNVFKKEKPDFTAEYAWIETTYGKDSFRTLEQRIKEKQEYIKYLIESKFPLRDERSRSSNVNGSYRCVVDIEEDLVCCVSEVFKPFVDGGFRIINLSEYINELTNENVYLISWKNIFKENITDKSKYENKTSEKTA